MKHKLILCLVVMTLMVGPIFAQESEFRMPEAGISMPALLYLFNFEVGEAEELAFIYAGDNDLWQGSRPLPDGFRYQFYIVNFTEEYYGVFATDESAGNRTSLHFFHQRNSNMNHFYSDLVPEMMMFNPHDEYVFVTEDFQLVENYYTELSNQFTGLVEQRNAAISRLEEVQQERRNALARIAELEETDEAYEEALKELEALNEELLHALSELDASEYEIGKLQERVRQLQAQVAELQSENDELRDEIAELEEQVAFLEELKDPYKVRMLELDREGYTPFFSATLGVENANLQNGDVIPFVEGEIGTYVSNERTGLVYFLVSMAADVNTDGKYGISPQVVFSFPREMIQVGTRANFGNSGRNSYIYRDMNAGYQGVISPFASVNVLGRDTRAGIEGGIEASMEESTHAYYLNFTYKLNTLYFPWLSIVVDELSFTNVLGEREGSRFNSSLGFDINWSAGRDTDAEWGGYTYSWFARINYYVDTDAVNDQVTDGVGVLFGARILFK